MITSPTPSHPNLHGEERVPTDPFCFAAWIWPLLVTLLLALSSLALPQ